MAGMNTDKPPAIATVTVTDPKIIQAIESVKIDTQNILAKLNETPSKPVERGPSYWPRGYFG